MPALILFDFDGILAHTEDLLITHLSPLLKEHLDPDGSMDMPAFMALRDRLFRTYGSTLYGWAKEKNLPREWIVEVQADTNSRVVGHLIPHLAPNALLNSRIQALEAAGHAIAVVTHSHRAYTLGLIEHLHLAPHFPPHLVFDTSALGGRHKSEAETYRFVEEKLGTKNPTRRIMLEDMLPNLVGAHAAGYTTYYVHPQIPHPQPPYVDHYFPTTLTALDHILRELEQNP